MILSKRLQCIADFVPVGSRVVDVGTDHGYIPLWLLKNGVCNYVVASDIREGPLQKAKENAERENLTDAIRFVLAPGLDGCDARDVDTILIAGMGGETIIEILSAAPWARDKCLVIQPQTKIPELRAWLNENGYDVKAATLVYDNGRLYVVWNVSAGERRALTETDLLLDPALIVQRDPLLPAYIDNLVKKLRYKIQGLEKAVTADDSELKENCETLEHLLRVRKEQENA